MSEIVLIVDEVLYLIVVVILECLKFARLQVLHIQLLELVVFR